MNKLPDIIKSLPNTTNWKDYVNENFERRAGTYTYATITEIEIRYKNEVFYYPTKIIFEYGYIKTLKNIIKTERIKIDKHWLKIVERKKVIPFSFYERKGKFTGEIYQILSDIVGLKVEKNGNYSTELLSTHDNPLYNIDSNQKWASYLLVLQRERNLNKQNSSETNRDLFSDLLVDYGIHYPYDPSLSKMIFVFFPMPYIKIVENKIKRRDSGEIIFLVLEFNELGMFNTSQSKIEIEAIIKDFNKNVIMEKTIPVKFDKSKHQVIEISPDIKGEIGFSAFSIKINNTLVEKTSGYYIRNIKIDIKTK